MSRATVKSSSNTSSVRGSSPNRLDFYLTSSEGFGQALKAVDAQAVLESISATEESEGEDEEVAFFNEKITRLLCLNQAIDKFQIELAVLQAEKDSLLAKL